MRVIRRGDAVIYVAPGVLLPEERAAAGASSEAVRRRWKSAMAAADRTMKDWEAVQQRREVFRWLVDAGWLLDDQAFARHQAERTRAMLAAADRGDARVRSAAWTDP